MQSLAPSAFEHRFQPLALKPFSEVLRGQFDGLEGNVGRGVEIEYHPVRMVDIVNACAPWMDFDRAHLDDFKQALRVLNVEVFVTLPLVLKLERLNVRAQALARITLVETLIVDTRGATQEAQRMTQETRQHIR